MKGHKKNLIKIFALVFQFLVSAQSKVVGSSTKIYGAYLNDTDRMKLKNPDQSHSVPEAFVIQGTLIQNIIHFIVNLPHNPQAQLQHQQAAGR